MRGIALVGLACTAVGYGSFAGTAVAQEASPALNPGSACFRLRLESPSGDLQREMVEFILAPAASPTRPDEQVWDLRGPIRAGSAALWRPLPGDSVAAWWLRDEGVLWELRLDALPEEMTGIAVQRVPEPVETGPWSARAVEAPCGPAGADVGTLAEGVWRGHLVPMNHPEQRTPVDLRVSRDGDTWTLELVGPGGSAMPGRDVEVGSARVGFLFVEPEAGVPLRCDLAVVARGTLRGRCADEGGKWAELTLRPPVGPGRP